MHVIARSPQGDAAIQTIIKQCGTTKTLPPEWLDCFVAKNAPRNDVRASTQQSFLAMAHNQIEI